jgi:hypothetical protein
MRNTPPLGTAVLKDSAKWPTPAVMDTTGGPYKTEFVDGSFRSYHNHTAEDVPKYGAKLSDAVTCGPAAQANYSTDGSRRELLATRDGSWTTPAATDTGRTTQYQQGGKALSMQAAWMTPIAQDSEHSGTNPSPNGERNLLANQANGKLNPRWVETLMGVPIGWTMPSCSSPVTIAPTNSDSSGTE